MSDYDENLKKLSRATTQVGMNVLGLRGLENNPAGLRGQINLLKQLREEQDLAFAVFLAGVEKKEGGSG